jgi:hypothetical protein
MNPAQLLNPKAFAKEKAKAAKRTPNYGMFTISLSSFTRDDLAIRYFRVVNLVITFWLVNVSVYLSGTLQVPQAHVNAHT